MPASKSATSETNLSTSSRPKTSSSGGNFLALVYSRKRRQVDNPPSHAFVLSNITSDSTAVNFPNSSTTEHDIDREHASTLEPLHDTNVTDTGTQLSTVTNSPPAETEHTQIQKVENVTTTAPPDPLTTTETDDSYQFEEADADHSFLDTSQLQDDPESFFSSIDLDAESKLEVEDQTSEEIKSKIREEYAYERQDEVQIVKLNHEPFSTTMKTKTNYSIARDKNSDSKELTDSNLSALPNPGADLAMKPVVNFNEPLLLHESNATNTVTKQFQAEAVASPKIRVIEVPPVASFGPSSAKRVLVNVTIATEPDSNNPHAAQSVYVLSVSVPTDDGVNQATNSDIKHSFQKEEGDKRTTQTPLETEKRDGPWGGACECSCPCMDASNEFADANNNTDYDYRDDAVKATTAAPDFHSDEASSVSDATDTTETSETWTPATVCPEVTTKLPPPPTILILEGRTASIDYALSELTS